MLKKFIYTVLIFGIALQANALEDCIISAKGQLFDIRIENHDIIDVYPLVTISNKKNTLIVHPLKTGMTAFTVMKNGKTKHLFVVNVKEDSTIIKGDEEFSIMTLDAPPVNTSFDLDLPPLTPKNMEVE